MPQTILDIRKRFTIAQHVHGAGMTKAMDSAQVFKPFFGQRKSKLFFTDTVNTMPGKFFASLINKEAMMREWFWRCPVFLNI